ncbi:hypothetical protein ACFCV3_11285 [Kribbella sp. NPDC056345]|uniref:hypothetical protein n=1 Tax=Kribbella sp. NPDC056345 TaxID=3345789 RepID=UPI0035D72D7A
MRRALMVVLGMVLTTVGLTAPAHADAPPHQEVYWQYFEPNGQKYQTVRVDCPAGMIATTAGADGEGYPSVSGSRSVDHGRGWELILSQIWPNRFSVQVVCWSGLSNLTTLTTWADVKAGAVGATYNVCPGGAQRFLGGGAYTTDPAMTPKNFVSYSNSGWQASFRNTTAATQRIFVQVLCADGLTGLRWQSTRGEHITDDSIAILRCPDGTEVVSAGALGPQVDFVYTHGRDERGSSYSVIGAEMEGDDTFFQARVLCAF